MTKYNVQRRLISLLFVMLSISLSAQNFSADRELFDAYMREDMTVWKAYVDEGQGTKDKGQHSLVYEYGFCGYIVSLDKEAAKPYVKRFRQHVEECRQTLPPGHYEMWMSAVYVYELRLHESFHPVKAMNLAQEATRLAPEDPLTLSYYGTSLFYAPKPFGSKEEALKWFERAQIYFRGPEWEYCWIREATQMYIQQCHEKLKK